MDTIFISDLRIETRIGVYEWEKHVRQPVLLNIEIAMPHSRAGATDALDDALDYAAVVRALKALLTQPPAPVARAAGRRDRGADPARVRCAVGARPAREDRAAAGRPAARRANRARTRPA